MTTLDCAVCGQGFDEAELLFSDRGRICAPCELDLAEQAALSRGVWRTVIGGPVTALAGSVMVCVPMVGPLFALVLGAMALWRGTVALQVLWMSRGDDAMGGATKGALLLSGALTALWSVGLVISGGVVGVYTLYTVFSTSIV